MKINSGRHFHPARWAPFALGVAAASYAGYAAVAWLRYGDASARREDTDPLLDRFMPHYDVFDRCGIAVNAPAEFTLEAAKAMDLQQSRIVRGIFKAREIVLGSRPVALRTPKGIVEETLALGWGVLAEQPGRQIVVGAVTKPWEADVTFRAVPPDQFAAFDEPGYVKIVWTLRADPRGASDSIFTTETRVATTDEEARARFRRYWALASPGIELIRRVPLRRLRADAERRARRRTAAA